VLGGEFEHAAAEQDQHEPHADGRRSDGPGGQAGQPADGVLAPLPAGAEQGGARLDGDRGDGGAGAGASAEHP
jgi:hypothetical protein